VFISDAGALRIANADDFESQGTGARSIAELSEAQAFALMNHLAYWFEQRPPDERTPDPGTVLWDYRVTTPSSGTGSQMAGALRLA
jgi:hypothetical protein